MAIPTIVNFPKGPKIQVTLDFGDFQFKKASLSFSNCFGCYIEGHAQKKDRDQLLAFLENYGKGNPCSIDLNLYQSSKITSHLSASKPRGSIDRKSVHISNIDRLAIVEPRELSRSLNASYFRGLVLEHLSLFRKKALSCLQKVPFGEVVTYGELADKIGHPKAARAIGTACHYNPYPIFIPCHRVIASGKRLGGFATGLRMKKLLLDFEKG